MVVRRHFLLLAALAPAGPSGAQVRDLNDAINKAGRQRMLSQRMAATYLAASWGVQTEASLTAMNAAREEFVKAHGELLRAPETTSSIRGELELVQQQYGFFDAALKVLNNPDPVAQ